MSNQSCSLQESLHNGTDVAEDASGPGPGNQYNVKTFMEF